MDQHDAKAHGEHMHTRIKMKRRHTGSTCTPVSTSPTPIKLVNYHREGEQSFHIVGLRLHLGNNWFVVSHDNAVAQFVIQALERAAVAEWLPSDMHIFIDAILMEDMHAQHRLSTIYRSEILLADRTLVIWKC